VPIGDVEGSPASVEDSPAPVEDGGPSMAGAGRPARDLQRTFRLVLATVWLLDAALQLQPNMFTRGSNGFSGMLDGVASGNPGFVYHSVTWNASNVYHQPIVSNTIFASVQFLISFGIVYKRTCRPALALSIVWAVSVWWFGEAAGQVFHGGATPFGGGPGGVLFYAVLAVLLWPNEGSDKPFVAARTVGLTVAKAIWTAVWGVLAVLSVVGSGRSPLALHDLVVGLDKGQPGWLAHIDRFSESLLLHHGTTLAVLLAVVCVVVAVGVYTPPTMAQFAVVLAIVVFALIWVAVQDVGGILAGGATDPNSGLLVILFALIYWPLTTARATATTRIPGPQPTGAEA
jgi:hypothetical protein